MTDKQKLEKLAKVIISILGLIGTVVCLFWWWVIRFQNVDMTTLRLIITHPEYIVVALLSAVLLIIGKTL